jgi:AcrR family transcriptional regulator
MKAATRRASRPTRAEKSAATSAALLSAAAATFAERGFGAATMDEIAERVGLSKGALYYRYKSKEDLFLALLDERCAAYVAELERTLGPEASPGAGWGAFSEQFLSALRDGSWPRLFFEYVLYASRDPSARQQLVKRTRALRSAFERVIQQQAAHAGTELPIPAADIALAIAALGNGLALERLADPRGVPDRVFSELPALIIAGVAAGAARQSERKEPG